MRCPVHQDAITQWCWNELAAGIEPFVLNGQRNIIHPIGPWKVKRGFLRVADNDQPGSAFPDLLADEHVRVRVVEVDAVLVDDLVFDVPRFSGKDLTGRTAVEYRRHFHAVPMHGGDVGQLIVDTETRRIPMLKLQCGTQVGRIDAIGLGDNARIEFHGAGRHLQMEGIGGDQGRDGKRIVGLGPTERTCQNSDKEKHRDLHRRAVFGTRSMQRNIA